MVQAKERKVGQGMGRKPAHVYQAATGSELPHEAMWRAIRKLRVFTTPELCNRLVHDDIKGINDVTVKSYLERLVRGGFIVSEAIAGRGDRVSRLGGSAHRYTLVHDIGVEAPRLNANGDLSTQGLGTENMWRAIKVLKSFDYRELANAATTDKISVAAATAKRYLIYLKLAGYLIEVQPATKVVPAKFRLKPNKNTGPKPPMIQRTHRVYDPNLKKIVWREDEA